MTLLTNPFTPAWEDRKRDLLRFISGKFIEQIGENAQSLRELLVFGCGDSALPNILATYLNVEKVIAYDTNESKINEMEERRLRLKGTLGLRINPKLTYTSRRPAFESDVLVAHAVLHENPQALTTEALSLLSPGGLIAVLDYDMKGMSPAEFFARWGENRSERAEIERLGDAETYRMHTSFGVDDCVRMMEQNGVTTLSANGILKSWCSESPSLHFYISLISVEKPLKISIKLI